MSKKPGKKPKKPTRHQLRQRCNALARAANRLLASCADMERRLNALSVRLSDLERRNISTEIPLP